MLDAATKETVQKKNLANVLAKLRRGGTLTAREQAIIAGGSGESGYCSNLDELGIELGVDRKTLANAKCRFAKSYVTPAVFAKVDEALSGVDAIDFADMEKILLNEVGLFK